MMNDYDIKRGRNCKTNFGVMKRINITIPDKYRQILYRIGNGNVSEGIRKTLESYLKNYPIEKL